MLCLCVQDPGYLTQNAQRKRTYFYIKQTLIRHIIIKRTNNLNILYIKYNQMRIAFLTLLDI